MLCDGMRAAPCAKTVIEIHLHVCVPAAVFHRRGPQEITTGRRHCPPIYDLLQVSDSFKTAGPSRA
ncbi:hypothetical protein M2266_005550 [Streptomyces sp. SPB162]|nr:hypothetical protein [Streptomyces sp. SPB162]